MSSLAATQADGYYVPPEYYDSGQYKKKSRNQFAGSKGHNQFLQRGVARFELPYDGFCKSCGTHVGKGTRFNAQKKEAGNYFTTTIYEFQMKCRICSKATFVIRTNPKERGFDYVEGISKQEKEFDTKEAGTAGVLDTEDGNRIIPSIGEGGGNLSRLEQMASGKRKTMSEHDELEALIKISHKTHYDDAASNAGLRKTFRTDRKARKKRQSLAKNLGWSEGMELADGTLQDDVMARDTSFGNAKRMERTKFHKLRSSSIFSQQRKTRKKNKPIRQHHVIPDTPTSANERVSSTSAEKGTGGENKVSQESSNTRVKKVKVLQVPTNGSVELQSTSEALSSLSALECYESSDGD